MRSTVLVFLGVVLLGFEQIWAGTWTNIDYPGAFHTSVKGISGDSIVGVSSCGGFLYNQGTWTDLALNPICIDGDRVLGRNDYGYSLYNLTTKSFLPWGVSDMGSSGADVRGMSGNTVIAMGPWGMGGIIRSYSWDRTNITWLDHPLALTLGETYAQGIDGSSIVGWYRNNSGEIQGFLCNDGDWMTLRYPESKDTHAFAISGNNVVGDYQDSSGTHGFLYNGESWITFSYPGAVNTYAYGISGNQIIGMYNAGSGAPPHGFIYTIPEPCTLLLFGLGGLALKLKNKRMLTKVDFKPFCRKVSQYSFYIV